LALSKALANANNHIVSKNCNCIARSSIDKIWLHGGYTATHHPLSDWIANATRTPDTGKNSSLCMPP
jgi:hypothetical protein